MGRVAPNSVPATKLETRPPNSSNSAFFFQPHRLHLALYLPRESLVICEIHDNKGNNLFS